MDHKGNVRSAEVVLRCTALDESLAFFVKNLGFRVDTIYPADDPSVAVLSGHGTRIRLQRDGSGESGVLRLSCDAPDRVAGGRTQFVAPGGILIELVAADAPVAVPPNQPAFTLSRARDEGSWSHGRAGMLYRDLIPGRQGGRFIASHIRIPGGGEVPDYVHFHDVRFQMIYCYKGWVRVVYEDQGPPFVLNAGDCVLQPPQIRHRVLESSPGLEVIEVGCPAEHPTHADHELDLPTKEVRADRDFGGQRFVRHDAQEVQWEPWREKGFEARDTGIGRATDGLAGARVVRLAGVAPEVAVHGVDAELLFTFVLGGSVSLDREGENSERLEAEDCFTIPTGVRYGLTDCSKDLELLEVSLPATPAMT